MQIIDPFMIINRKSMMPRRRSSLAEGEKKETRGLPRSIEELQLVSNRSESKLERLMSPK